MPFIKWRDSYSVGVEQFDNEHRKLVELINRMFVIVRDKDDIMAVSDAVGRLIDYTEFHFASEEDALEKSDFPDIEAHKKLHEDLKQQVIALQQRIMTDKESVRVEVYSFLRGWLITHILEEDKKYSEFLTDTIPA